MKIDENALYQAVEDYVKSIRGSYDAPGFDACVESEYINAKPIVELYLKYAGEKPKSVAVACILAGANNES